MSESAAALEIYDISLIVHEDMPVWPGHDRPRLTKWMDMSRGDGANVTNCSFCAHVGTHVDAPLHYYAGGAGVDGAGLEGFMGSALVADMTHAAHGIAASDLEPVRRELPFDVLLLKTRNSTVKNTAGRFDETYIYLETGAVDLIRAAGIKGVGIDALGIERFTSQNGETHKAMLAEPALALIEGLDLRGVAPGLYWFACLPVRLKGADGAPARAILIRDPEGGFLEAWRASRRIFPATITSGSAGDAR